MLHQIPSLNSLRAFEVVSRHLNYHAAAKELNVTPAAVKQLVSKLEDRIGVKLVKRAGKGLVLTPRGQASCNDLSLGMEKFAAAVDKMRGERKRNQLIVTVETSFATAWLVPKLEQFRQRHPEINVLIDSTQNIVDLSLGEVDVAIRYGVANHGNLIAQRLFDDLIFPACSPSLVTGSQPVISLQQLNNVPLIHWDTSHLDWVRETKRWFDWDRWLARVGIEGIDTDGGIIFNDYGLAVQAAIAGQGMLLASWPILREPIESGLLTCPFRERITTDIGYDLVITQENQQRPDVKAFCDWVLATISDEQLPLPAIG